MTAACPTDLFFVLTGIDAAGKTSALDELRRRRPDWAIGSYEPTDWLPHPDLPHFDWALERHPRSVVHDLEPDARAGFLIDMMLAHWAYWLRPRLLDGRVVIMDSYRYRFCAKERVRGIVPAYFYDAMRAMTDASTIIVAEVPPEIAYERKAELGVHEFSRRPTRDDFCGFQRRVHATLMDICTATGARLEHLDATLPAADVADGLERLIEESL